MTTDTISNPSSSKTDSYTKKASQKEPNDVKISYDKRAIWHCLNEKERRFFTDLQDKFGKLEFIHGYIR